MRGKTAAGQGSAEGAASAVSVDVETPGEIFVPWAEWFEAHFCRDFGLVEEPLPEHLAFRQGDGSGEPGPVIAGRLFTSKDPDSPIRRLRITLVDNGGQLQAFNAAVYPSHSMGPLPVLGVDVLTFNNHSRLLFGVDWSPMVPGEEYAEANIGAYVGEVRAKNASILMEPSGKFYGEIPEFFSPYMFFSRPSGAQALQVNGELWAVFSEYCARYSALLRKASPAPPEAVARAEVRQNDYDKWHADRDPAMPIFRRLFGEAWTEEFIGRVLFPGSAEASVKSGPSD